MQLNTFPKYRIVTKIKEKYSQLDKIFNREIHQYIKN